MVEHRPTPADARRESAWVLHFGRRAWAALGIIAVAVIVIAMMVWLRGIVVPLLLAGFLGIAGEPLVSWLNARRVPRSVGAVLVIVLIGGAFFGAIAIAAAGVADQTDDLAGALDRADEELTQIFDDLNIGGVVEELSDQMGQTEPLLGPGFSSGITSALGSLAGFVSGMVLGVVLLYYLLRDGPMLTRAATSRVPEERRQLVQNILASSTDKVRQYFKGRTILALIQGVAVAAALAAFGLPLPIAVGVVNVIGAFVPYLGAFVGGAFAVLMGLAGGGIDAALYALAVVLLVNLVIENLLEPSLMGSSLKMHPIAILLVTVGGGIVAGLVGLILAGPLAAIVIEASKEIRRSKGLVIQDDLTDADTADTADTAARPSPEVR